MGVIAAFRVPEAPGITSGLVYRTEVEALMVDFNGFFLPPNHPFVHRVWKHEMENHPFWGFSYFWKHLYIILCKLLGSFLIYIYII